MATRPVFVPETSGERLVTEVHVEFQWSPGMAPSQKRKNVRALHESARGRGLGRLLEISTKSDEEIGRRLSAFSLTSEIDGMKTYFECAYQGSKVFRLGGPYKDLFSVTPKQAKKDPRLRSSGELTHFEFEGQRFPLLPKNAFYDWLYVRSLLPHLQWIMTNVCYDGFTDIEFNPKRSINCQARAFAELIAIARRGEADKVRENFRYFSSLLPAV